MSLVENVFASSFDLKAKWVFFKIYVSGMAFKHGWIIELNLTDSYLVDAKKEKSMNWNLFTRGDFTRFTISP